VKSRRRFLAEAAAWVGGALGFGTLLSSPEWLPRVLKKKEHKSADFHRHASSKDGHQLKLEIHHPGKYLIIVQGRGGNHVTNSLWEDNDKELSRTWSAALPSDSRGYFRWFDIRNITEPTTFRVMGSHVEATLFAMELTRMEENADYYYNTTTAQAEANYQQWH
jgi:hypothetical protein